MSNLVELVKGLFGDALVERLKPFLGVDAQKAGQAADAAIPALVGGLLNKLQGEGGIDSVFDFLKPFLGGKFDFGKTWSPGGGVVDLLTKGHSILGSLFGDQVGDVTKSVAKAAALPDHEAGKLLKVAAPGLMGAIGSLLGEGASKADLAGLLAGQIPHLEGKLPAGLPFDFGKLSAGIGALGLGATAAGLLGGATDKVEEVKEVVTEKADSAKDTVVAAGAAVAATAAAATSGLRITVDEPEKVAEAIKPAAVAAPIAAAAAPIHAAARGADKGKGYLLPLVLGGSALAGILWYLGMKPVDPDLLAVKADVKAPAVSTPEVSAPDTNVPEVNAPEVSAPEVNVPSGGDIKVTLDNGVELDAKVGGIEDSMVKFIKSDAIPTNKSWFNFDRLYFDTAKATLKPESEAQLKNIVEILKAYPKVNMKVGGYTDNVGNKQANMKLSADRAETTMKRIISMGVAAARLKFEGYGDTVPEASNATAEGRAKNRRVAVRILTK
jgi:OmpA-OmpF porin, OOP family